MAHVDMIYYLDVLSSWCNIADRALERIESKYGTSVRIDWRIAQLYDFAPLPYTRENLQWYYDRTERVTGIKLNADWYDSQNVSTVHANAAAEAARMLGAKDSLVRRALSRAAVVEGKPMGRREAALEEAARVSGFSAAEIARAMESSQVRDRIVQTTNEFKAIATPQRPTFVLRNTSGDLAVLSGLYTFEALDAVISEMLHASRISEEIGPEPA